jgi:hypothetical protein
MLAAEGHVVVHSTRHAPIEFGKDVITLAPDGVPCAFQLKGNPGGRLTLSQLRATKEQLLELVTQPIVHPAINFNRRHRCYLVTNGEADEEVHRSLDDINRQIQRLGFGARRIKLWQRGHLLSMATRLGSSLWPSEIDDLNILLELLVHRGDDVLPASKIHNLLQKLLHLFEDDKKRRRRGEMERLGTSAALLIGVALGNFSRADNHYATISAWTMYIVYWIAACERHKVRISGIAKSCIELARTAIMDALVSLCKEIKENKDLIPKNAIEIAPIFQGRATLVYALMSVYWLWSEEVGWLVSEDRQFLMEWLPRNYDKSILWGEGAVPQYLAHYWYISRTDATSSSASLLGGLLGAVIDLCTTEVASNFPNPYFTFEEVMRHHLSHFLQDADEPLQDESGVMTSYTALSLLHLLVRMNLKRSCKMLWPDITRLGMKHFEPEEAWQYGLWRSKRGRELTVQPTPATRWDDLVKAARDCRVLNAPSALLKEKHILLLHAIIFPYRATPEIIRYLGRQFDSVWFIPPPIEQ